MSVSIEIRNLTKKYGKVTALDRVSLTIEGGEFLVLLGPSGCGKTTILRCIAGLERPDEGDIVIDNRVVFSSRRGVMVPSGKRQVGMVFQSYALWPHMEVYENIGFGLRLQKVPRKEVRERVDRVLQDLSMDGLGDRYPSELSGGQQQRVAVARLLATKPPVFLMDEPLSNLDARLRLDMRSELKRLHHDSGVTTVYVTHDQTEAMTMANRVAVMKDGLIQQVANPREIYDQPSNVFVAEFVGMPKINMLPAKTLLQDGQPWLEIDDFRLPVSWVPSGDRAIVAIRPENVSISLEPDRRRDTTLVVREIRQLDLQIDQPVWIRVDPSAINLYDEKSGLLLTSEEQA
jgi:multiple sugar transport system ATP-binding protein